MKTRWLVLCILLWGLTPLSWFQPGHLITTTDLYLPTPPADWYSQLFVWNPRFGTGAEWMTGPSAQISTGLTAAVMALGGPERLAQQVDFVVWFLLPALTMWWFLRQILPGQRHWVVHLVAVNVYMFNLFLEALWAGNKAGLSAYAVLPLLLGLVYRALHTRRWLFYGAWCALASVLGSGASTNPQVSLVMVFTVALFILCYGIAHLRTRRAWFELLGFLVVTTSLTVGCHAFWLLPQLALAQDPITVQGLKAFANETLSWLSGLSAFTSLYNVARMQGAWTWYQGWYEPYATYSALFRENPGFIVLSWAWVGLVGIGIAASRRWIDGFFILLAIVGVVFGTGIHPPFGAFYKWCIQHVFLFGLIRSPWYKFTLLTCLGYAYLIGRASQVIYEWLRRRAATPHRAWRVCPSRVARLLPPLSLVGIICVSMVYALPVTTGRMYPTALERAKLKPCHVQVPEYVQTAGRWFDAQPGFFRIFHTPKHTNGVSVYRWGFVGIPPVLYHTSTRPLLFTTMPLAFQESGNQLAAVAHQALYEGKTHRLGDLLHLLGVRYLLQEDDVDYDYFEADGDDPQFIASCLAEQPAFVKFRAFGPWQVYEIRGAPPAHASVARVAVLVEGGAEALAPLASFGWLAPQVFLVLRDAPTQDATAEAVAQQGLLQGACLMNRRSPELSPLAAKAPRLLVVQETASLEASIESATVLPASVLQVQLDPTWFAPRQEPDGTPWIWLKAGGAWDESHLIIENRTGQTVTTNFQLVVQSFGMDRNLYFYVNGELFAHPPMPHGAARTLLLRALPLKPGRNTIRFYSPSAWSTREDGAMVCFAFRPDLFRFGRLVYRGTVAVPRADTYRVSLWRYGVRRRAEGVKSLRVGVRELALPARAGVPRLWGAVSTSLPAGECPFEVAQSLDDDTFALVLEAGQPFAERAAEPVELRSQDPTAYTGTLQMSTPGVVVFNESYSPRWQIIEAATGQPVTNIHWKVNGFANGFWVPKPGTYQIRFNYQGQAAAWRGWRVAWGTWGLCVLLLVGSGCMAFWRRRRR